MIYLLRVPHARDRILASCVAGVGFKDGKSRITDAQMKEIAEIDPFQAYEHRDEVIEYLNSHHKDRMRSLLDDGSTLAEEAVPNRGSLSSIVEGMSDDVFSSGLSMPELGSRIRAERMARGLGLERLAQLSGVSRSMVSEVERGAKTPSVLIVDRLATALGTSIAKLLDEPVRPEVKVLKRSRQRVVRDASGWERRILSPVLPGVEFEFMRTTLGPGVDAGEFSPHPHGSHEYVAVEAGCLLLTINGTPHSLEAGDAAYFPGDCVHTFANDDDVDCVYYLAMTLGEPMTGGRHG